MKIILASLIVVTVAVWKCDAFCRDIRKDPEVALIVGECQSKHMPTEFMVTLIECVNGRLDRQVTWSEFFTALCTETPDMETSLAFHIRRCLDEQIDYIQDKQKRAEIMEGSDKADECIATRLNAVGERTDRRERRSPLAEAFKLQKRSADVYNRRKPKRRTPIARG